MSKNKETEMAKAKPEEPSRELAGPRISISPIEEARLFRRRQVAQEFWRASFQTAWAHRLSSIDKDWRPGTAQEAYMRRQEDIDFAVALADAATMSASENTWSGFTDDDLPGYLTDDEAPE